MMSSGKGKRMFEEYDCDLNDSDAGAPVSKKVNTSSGVDSESSSDDSDYDTEKKCWLKKFFDDFMKSTTWHCPACRNVRGQSHVYKTLNSLIQHAESTRQRRKLHQKFASELDYRVKNKELQRTGDAENAAMDHWVGLKHVENRGKIDWPPMINDEENRGQIIWPPMVLVRNTNVIDGGAQAAIGMGVPELSKYFGAYPYQKGSHSYGPFGHRGMSILIFESSAKGYFEAKRLGSDFAEQGFGRDTWNEHAVNAGKRQLYGYMPNPEVLGEFNKHHKKGLKYEMKSY